MSNTDQTGQMFVVFQLCFLWAGTVGDYLKDFGRFSLLELFFYYFLLLFVSYWANNLGRRQANRMHRRIPKPDARADGFPMVGE